jgi:hypothetical protein
MITYEILKGKKIMTKSLEEVVFGRDILLKAYKYGEITWISPDYQKYKSISVKAQRVSKLEILGI